MSRLDDTVDLLDRLVAMPTVSSESNMAMIAFAAERLETLGARCHVQNAAEGGKANLFATLGPDVGGGIVLSGHTDMVPATDQDWSSDPFTLRGAGGTALQSRGL